MKKEVFLYCRRSSEGEDKQMLSIPSQIKELKDYARKLDLDIVKVFEESMSAKAPGRPKFAEMMSGLANGEAEGILCWKLDRLARNPVDGGAINWAMKDLKVEIITPGHTYSQANEDSLLMYLEFGMAQKFIDDLGKNSLRGMKTKAEMGWYPSPAPLGYKNTPDRKKGFKIIEVDEQKHSLVRRIFEEVLSGKQACEVYQEVSENWKFTSQRGTILSRSAFYSLLTKPFYYGEFEWPEKSGIWYKGLHKPMITRDEYDRVQVSLGKLGRPIARSHVFDLTGLFRCGKCGGAITASQKTKHYLTTNRTANYTYYTCAGKNKKTNCDARPMTETDLIGQIDKLLLTVKPNIEFINWAKKWLSFVHQDKSAYQAEKLKSQQNSMQSIESRLNKLLDLRLNDVLDDESYKAKKAELEEEKRVMKNKLAETSDGLDNGRVEIESALEYAYTCQKRFEKGLRDVRQEIMLRICSDLHIKPNKLLDVKLKSEFEVLSKQGDWELLYTGWLEPVSYTEIMDKYPNLRPANPVWLPLVDSDHELTA